MKSIYEIYVPVTSQEQADRLKEDALSGKNKFGVDQTINEFLKEINDGK